jgi:antitoxin YefM
MSIMPLGEARDHFSEVIGTVERTHERVTVTRHGEAVAVIISPDDLEAMEETLDILSSPELMEQLRRSQADLEAGRVHTHDEVVKSLGLDT